jgi:hypothetical protein
MTREALRAALENLDERAKGWRVEQRAIESRQSMAAAEPARVRAETWDHAAYIVRAALAADAEAGAGGGALDALTAELDHHWLQQGLETGVALCTCGEWSFDARVGQQPLPVVGERFAPFSRHVAEAAARLSANEQGAAEDGLAAARDLLASAPCSPRSETFICEVHGGAWGDVPMCDARAGLLRPRSARRAEAGGTGE